VEAACEGDETAGGIERGGVDPVVDPDPVCLEVVDGLRWVLVEEYEVLHTTRECVYFLILS